MIARDPSYSSLGAWRVENGTPEPPQTASLHIVNEVALWHISTQDHEYELVSMGLKGVNSHSESSTELRRKEAANSTLPDSRRFLPPTLFYMWWWRR